MKILCENIEDGLIPSEKVARLLTADGRQEEVVVSPSSLMGNMLCASEVSREGNKVLVELPRESSSGKWRLWIDKSKLGG